MYFLGWVRLGGVDRKKHGSGHRSKCIILKFVKEVAKTLVKLRITLFNFDRFSNQSSNFIYFFSIMKWTESIELT